MSKVLTNSEKVEILNQHGYKLNPFTEMMFGQKTYHKEYPTHGISMGDIMKHNKSIITQTELDEAIQEWMVIDLISKKVFDNLWD